MSPTDNPIEALAALSTIVALGVALLVIMTEPIGSDWPDRHAEGADDDAVASAVLWAMHV